MLCTWFPWTPSVFTLKLVKATRGVEIVRSLHFLNVPFPCSSVLSCFNSFTCVLKTEPIFHTTQRSMTNERTRRPHGLPCVRPTSPTEASLLWDLGRIDRALKSHYPLRPNFLTSDHPLIDFGSDALILLTLSVMTSRDGTKNSSQTRASA